MSLHKERARQEMWGKYRIKEKPSLGQEGSCEFEASVGHTVRSGLHSKSPSMAMMMMAIVIVGKGLVEPQQRE